MEFGSLVYDRSQLELNWWTKRLADPKQLRQTEDTGDSEKYAVPYVDFTHYVKSNEWELDGEIEAHTKLPYRR
ncbi:unnamed protein product [Protopolystoma xenopodis]|uniref:Uncharacterized protein n=1 Tax=Protopolystoma xenopodis TaxID=117903 RepID=A0A448WMK4_9PLAT|nr:unnamed protein product [Protopolystoma xenopodis]